MPAARIVWTTSPAILTGRIAMLARAFPHRVDMACAEAALHGESYAKVSAPWTNRTGAARAGLSGKSSVRNASGAITLSHGVDYGIWLELAHGRRYAILPQTLQSTVADLQGRLAGMLGRAI